MSRRFIPLSSALAHTRPSKPVFTLLSYNMLSPSYMWPQVYTYVPEKYKDWKYRHGLLEQELLNKYKADIMCLQELTSDDYSGFWKKALKDQMNYGSKFIAKTPPKYWTKSPDLMDGVGIFYNLDKFDFISWSGIYLNQLLGMFTNAELDYLKSREIILTDGAGNETGKDNLLQVLKNKNQVALFVSLKHKETGNVFVVINTHLYWKYDEVKLTQCMSIMRELARIIEKHLVGLENVTDDKIKILFTGDLNSTADSLVINFLKGQIVNHGNLNVINPMKPYLEHCVYDDVPKELFTHTCYSGKLKGIFDYIWYHDTDFKLRRILSGNEVSEELEAKNQFGLPNENHPSDHIPLLTEFEIL
ncbi:RNA exonuclease NGL1 [Nakaseomyces bracarensis]|uniref:RNA exonuclease NGL1 n=1 Tax=Nakaseomyces bracarensis TaxID=273131 RepID=A0ABR4NZT3_9SACH